MTGLITQTFIPGPRLIDGTDLNNLVQQANSALILAGGASTVTALTTNGAGTITAAGIFGGITARGGTQAGVAFNDTTDTAAAILALLSTAAPVGSTLLYIYENNTDAQATIIAGVGITLSGNAVIPKLTTANYLFTKTSSTAMTMQYVGGGQIIPLPVAKYSIDTVHTGGVTTLQVAGLVGAQVATIQFGDTTPGTVSIGPAADIAAAFPQARPGLSILVNFKNPAANTTAQLTGLTGVTFTGRNSINPGGITNMQMDFDSLTSIHFTSIAQTAIVAGS